MMVKKNETIAGGLFGSPRKMWWISGSLPYRRGFSYAGAATLGSGLNSMSNTGLIRPWAEPKDARTTVAFSGFVASCS